MKKREGCSVDLCPWGRGGVSLGSEGQHRLQLLEGEEETGPRGGAWISRAS